MPVKKKSGVSRDEWSEAREVLNIIEIGRLRVPEHIRDLATWLEGPGSGLHAGDVTALLGDKSNAALKAAAK